MLEYLHAIHELAPGVVQRVNHFLGAGGVVMGPLLLLGFAMWYMLALRALELRRGPRGLRWEAIVATAAAAPPPSYGIVETAACEIAQVLHGRRVPCWGDIDLCLRRARAGLDRGARVIQTLVAAAPLLGLLGTVMGMIETFDSLRDMAMFAESGGVAGGISEALITTETGLGIAIPGLLFERFLHQRARGIERDLLRLETLARLWRDTPAAEAA